jgi:hypothetical protein
MTLMEYEWAEYNRHLEQLGEAAAEEYLESLLSDDTDVEECFTWP